MAFVDGTLDDKKLDAVLALAAKLGVKEDFVDDVAKLAQGHLHDATAHMIRANLESITGQPSRPTTRCRGSCPTRTNPIRRSPRASMRSPICRRTPSGTPSRRST